MERLHIRDSLPGDEAAIEALYPAAFPDEDLLPVVQALLQDATVVLSLVGTVGASMVGHALFTTCAVSGCHDRVALLGPLAVGPPWQRQGFGGALVRAGLRRLDRAGVTRVCVLGDPAYYGRFGFGPEADVDPPYALPAAWRPAWQSASLGAVGAPVRGTLAVPPPWRDPALWAP